MAKPVSSTPPGAIGVTPLGRQVTVGSLDSLIRHAKRRGVEIADVGLLVGDRHLHDQPVQALDGVSIEAELDRDMPHPLQHLILPLLVAERERRFELGGGRFAPPNPCVL